MRERTSATISIMRAGVSVTTVPITEQCTRRYTLMSEDSINLDFTLGTAVHFAIGDYVDDEIFGRFVLAREQMPQYDAQTGGYKYTLQLVAEYMTWGNRKLMMTQVSEDVRTRKEAQWRLTADLETQVAEIISNVECLGFSGYSYSIETSAQYAKEVKLMSYDGTSIIEALNKLADEWQCEWWVSDKVLHLGKCESEDDALSFKLGETVESMTISDNRNSFASKVFVFGSTKNMPPTYRKELKLLTTAKETKNGVEIWRIDKALTQEMFPASMPIYVPMSTKVSGTDIGKTVITTYEVGENEVTFPSAYSMKSQAVTFGACYVIPDNQQSIAEGTSIQYTVSVQLFMLIGETAYLIAENSISGTSAKMSGSMPGFAIPSITLPAVNVASRNFEVGKVKVYMRHIVRNQTYDFVNNPKPEITPTDGFFLEISQVGSSVLKVHGKVKQTSEVEVSWTQSRFYKVGSKDPTLDTDPTGAVVYGYKTILTPIALESGKTYKATMMTGEGIAAVVFLDASNRAVGWLNGNGTSTEYAWSAAEHKDATKFVMTSISGFGNLTVITNNVPWNSYIRVNAIGADISSEDSYTISFCSQAGVVSSTYTPPSLEVGGYIIVNDESTTIRVPSAFYTTEYDNPSALSKIGETRLQMPTSTNGYLMADGTSESNAVEEVVVFEDIYPRCDLVVESIDEYKRTDRTEYAGEDATANWQWTEYTLKLKKANGEPFSFSEEYMLSGEKLQIKFLTNDDMQGVDGYEQQTNGCKLSGMTFDVEFRKSGEYIIGRNDEYGAMLPNDLLRPNVGDPCILIGWNARAMNGLGLIEDAEERLQTKGEEYMEALEEGQFTFDCSMMSDFAFDQIPYLRLFEANDKRVKDYDDKYIWVKNGHNAYLVPIAGARVSITHGALASAKTSRIIGYELKLDKPYDTPRYTVGETQAYSKLAKIERELSKING